MPIVEITRAFSTGLVLGIVIAVAVSLLAGMILAIRWQRRMSRLGQSLRRIRLATRRRAERLADRATRNQRLAEIGTLTGGLAHEIKNPLSTVQLNLQLLQEELDPRDPVHARLLNRLMTVSRETARLRDILDDFLKYAGKLELRRQQVDLNQLLEELADFFAPQAERNRVQLRLKRHPTPMLANIDARLIKQTVLNLMLNAMQAMPNGGELILAASGDDLWAIIEVIDTGSGISADARDKIFDAYYSTKRGGTGLGLAMAKRIIEEHHGEIEVRSELGKGSDFIIRLPK